MDSVEVSKAQIVSDNDSKISAKITPILPRLYLYRRMAFDNVTVTLKGWHRPYAMHFDLKHRTFRVATAATRETRYIMMHAIVAPVLELGQGKRNYLPEKSKCNETTSLA